jgi:hypothetical protein
METSKELDKSTNPTNIFSRVVPQVFGPPVIQRHRNVGGLFIRRGDNESSTARVDLLSVWFTLQSFSRRTVGRYLTRPDRDLDHMSMVLLVQRKRNPLISCQINCSNCQYSRQRPARPLVQLLPLPKRRMYTVCNRQTQRPPSSLKERRNNERRVRGIRNPPTMLAGET